MATVEASEQIARPPATVFAYLTDPAHATEWVTDAQQFAADGPMGVGTTLQVRTAFMGRPLEGTQTVTEYDPDRRYVLASDVPFPSTMAFDLEPTAAGTTIRMRLDAQLTGFLALGGTVVTNAIRQRLQTDLGNLRTLLETGRPDQA